MLVLKRISVFLVPVSLVMGYSNLPAIAQGKVESIQQLIAEGSTTVIANCPVLKSGSKGTSLANQSLKEESTTENTNPENTNTENTESPIADLPTLKIGMRGSEVFWLQKRLQAIGFFQGSVDGIFGKDTQAAVIAAQEKYGLKPDGIVGVATWQAILP